MKFLLRLFSHVRYTSRGTREKCSDLGKRLSESRDQSGKRGKLERRAGCQTAEELVCWRRRSYVMPWMSPEL